MTVTVEQIKQLRADTGASMMACKKALEETNGDQDKAIDILRKSGEAKAAKRAERSTGQGVVASYIHSNNKIGVLVHLGCETDFVAKNADFVALANKFADLAIDQYPANLEELLALEVDGQKVSDIIVENTGKIGEKIGISKYETVVGEKVVPYIHGNYRLGVLVALNQDVAGVEEAGKDVAMQIAAMSPVALDKADVDATTIERETEIAKEQIRAEGKPEAMVEKIAAGKLNKFYKDSTLLNQEFVKDSSKDVRKFLNDTANGLTVTSFKRVQLGS